MSRIQSRHIQPPQKLQREIFWLLKEKYDGKKTKEAERDILRIEKGEPVDYVIGFSDFLGCRIDLSKRPLIPRPETEYWTEQVIEEMKRHEKKSLRCLDLFAGSGCIGIAVLKHIPRSQVDFAEKYARWRRRIEKNLEINGIAAGRWRVLQSDVCSRIKDRYDYIFANPPYVAVSRASHLQSSVADWEPRQALFAGQDGLALIGKFLSQAKNHLNPEGKIYMEFDSWQKPAIARLLKRYGYTSFEFRKDQYGKWRTCLIF